MRRISILVTVLVTSLVMTLSGLVASPMASAASSQTVAKSFTFPTGSSDLTKSQKTKIKKAVATAGKNASFRVTGTAGKLPGVSDSTVRLLAKKRGQVIKAYLVKLGVKKSHVTIKLKITELGIVPKTKLVGSYVSSKPTPAASPSTPALACADGGTCVLGEPGPGGGIIYYVDTAGFKCGSAFTNTGSPTGGKCHYLEVAPSGWNNGGTPSDDPQKEWAVGINQTFGITEIADEDSAYNNALGIGLGYKNSNLIVAQNGAYIVSLNDYAAGAARAYTSTALSVIYSDWYLPTSAELNLLCQWSQGVDQIVTTYCTGGTLNEGTGASESGLMDSFYWSSSEQGDYDALFQLLSDGLQRGRDKNTTYHVRPVRAF